MAALLFVGSGRQFARMLAGAKHPPASMPEGALGFAGGYFFGLCIFLACFIPLSRLVGARWALAIILGAMAIAAARELANSRPGRGGVMAVLALLALVALGSATDLLLWLMPGEGSNGEPLIFSHYGSMHSGRYANYAVAIALLDRVPFIAQNGANSILASLHLLTGAASPLAALMVWIPFSLAFLALLVFGLCRREGFAPWPCALATALVMYCNVAVSAVHVLVFDNGSPLAFIGYGDLIIGTATFLLLARWLQALAMGVEPISARSLAVPFLLAMTSCWFAPQNLVLGAGALAFAAGGRPWRLEREPRRRMALAAVAALAGIVAGVLQFGTLLPKPMQEDTGTWRQEVSNSVAIRPYAQYLRSQFNGLHWNFDVGKEQLFPKPYERAYEHARTRGRDEVYSDIVWLFEEQLWNAVRAYGFPILGILLLAASLRLTPGGSRLRERAWARISAAAFGAGFLIAFGLELGEMKWWLTRFLVAGSAMGLVCLGLAALHRFSSLSTRRQAVAWTVLLGFTTVGPAVELAAAVARNAGVWAATDPFTLRLSRMVASRGQFLFETLDADPRLARLDGQERLVVGETAGTGAAVWTRPMALPAGPLRLGFRIELQRPAGDASALLELSVERGMGPTPVARRAFGKMDLDKDGWAWIDVDMPSPAPDARLRLWKTSDALYVVTGVMVTRR